MKLYEVPNNSIIRVKDHQTYSLQGPPGSLAPIISEIYKFKHIDGMYSLCYDKHNQIVHLPAWADVEILEE